MGWTLLYHPADHFCATTLPLVRTTLVLLLLKIFVHDQIDLEQCLRVTNLFLEVVKAKHVCKIEKQKKDKISITCDILMSFTQPNQDTISHQILNHKKRKGKEEETHQAIQ